VASGSGAVARRILGTVVVGGMTLSTVLGLIFIPVTFSVVEYLSHRFVRGGGDITMDCKSTPKAGRGKGVGGDVPVPAEGD
jgi:hydrophobic/amphiphilic exporter-1 (mainly G- bacteria), HAE1 family